MRKAISPILGIVLALLILLIAGVMTGSAKGSISDAVGAMRGSMGDWSCDDAGVVGLGELGDMMYASYNSCKLREKCECKSVTLDEGVEGDYYNIAGTDGVSWLKSHGFRNEFYNEFLGYIRVWCDGEQWTTGHKKIMPYYIPKASYEDKVPVVGSTQFVYLKGTTKYICSGLGFGNTGYFAIPNGAKISIKPRWYAATALAGEGVELKLTIDGGTFVNPKPLN